MIYTIFYFVYFLLQASAVKRILPLLDRILVQRAEALTQTAGGIVIPDTAQKKVREATVVAVGPGARNKVNIVFTSCAVIHE